MTERRAMGLLYASSVVFTALLTLGLAALGANPETISLGFLVVLIAGAVAASRVTMYYGTSRRRHDK